MHEQARRINLETHDVSNIQIYWKLLESRGWVNQSTWTVWQAVAIMWELITGLTFIASSAFWRAYRGSPRGFKGFNCNLGYLWELASDEVDMALLLKIRNVVRNYEACKQLVMQNDLKCRCVIAQTHTWKHGKTWAVFSSCGIKHWPAQMFKHEWV